VRAIDDDIQDNNNDRDAVETRSRRNFIGERDWRAVQKWI